MHHCGHTVLYRKKITPEKHRPYLCNYIHCSSKRRQLVECIPQKAIHRGQSSGVTFPFFSLLPENQTLAASNHLQSTLTKRRTLRVSNRQCNCLNKHTLGRKTVILACLKCGCVWLFCLFVCPFCCIFLVSLGGVFSAALLVSNTKKQCNTENVASICCQN